MGQIPTTPSIIPVPFATNGQKNAIPETVSTAGSPNASWSNGFPSITMINKQAGGKPPLGMDFNGVLNQLSNNAFFAQSGGLYPWNSSLNYLAGSHVQGSNGVEYIAMKPSGPDIPASGSGYVGAQNPTTDNGTYWLQAVSFAAAIFVDGTNGSDSNDGLTSATAVKTINKALELSQAKVFFTPNNIASIKIAAGSYSEAVSINTNVQFILLGNVSISGDFTVDAGIWCKIIGDYTITLNGSVLITSNASFLLATSECNINGNLAVQKSFVFTTSDINITSSSGTQALRLDIGSVVWFYSGTLHVTASNINSGISVWGSQLLCKTVQITVTNVSTAIDVRHEARAYFSYPFTIDGNSCTIGLYSDGNSETVFESDVSISNIVSDSAIQVVGGSEIEFNNSNVQIYGGGTGLPILITGNSIVYNNSSNISLIGKNTLYGAMALFNGATFVQTGSSATLALNCSVTAGNCIFLSTGSTFTIGEGTLSLSGSYTDAVLNVQHTSCAQIAYNAVVNGSPTGPRFYVGNTSTISVSGAGVNRIPGSSAGSANAATYGCYA